jgi:hypothetical protein
MKEKRLKSLQEGVRKQTDYHQDGVSAKDRSENADSNRL